MRLWPLLLLCWGIAGAAEPDWVADDPYERAMAVSEGELRFLPNPPDRPVHEHHNRIFILPESLQTGWVRLYQCHRHLDPVAAIEIVFPPGTVRQLELVSHGQVASARIDGHSVQLQGVAPGAEVCLRAETRALHRLADGRYELRNGPYMRRFLDGYYPMHVILDVRYPASLRLETYSPVAQPGVSVTRSTQGFLLDAWFEGILTTRLQFIGRS